MANTVNDVMNVIASPDYGIKNIAGTTHEILAIMEGTHNSQNNIHAIVDDIKNLLRSLVDTSQESRPVEVGNNQTRINNRHIQNILDETKGIRRAIDNIANKIKNLSGSNMPTVAKLSDKASEMVANAMVANIKKQNKDSPLSNIIDTFKNLKGISIKDIFLGKKKMKHIAEVFKDANENLKIKEKDLNSIIKCIKVTPEIVNVLTKIGGKLDKIIKKDVVKKLSIILVGESSILAISNELGKNEKSFNKANKVAKSIKELATSLQKAMGKLILASLLGVIASKGIEVLSKMVEKLTPLTKKLIENKKNFDEASKAAVKLSVFAGAMSVASLLFATIAVTGLPAMLGALFMTGIISLCTLSFKALAKANKNIIKGSIALLIMGGSLILFGIALDKIVKATKDVSWKQIGTIAGLTVLLSGTLALIGIPVVAGFVALGSVAVAIMSGAMILFAKSLEKISSISENIKSDQINNITNTMKGVATGVSGMAKYMIPVTLGAASISVMSLSLRSFAKTLKKISNIGNIPTRQINQVLGAMHEIVNYYTENPIDKFTIKQARRYKRMLRPFGYAVGHLAKLKTLGTIPTALVNRTLDAMSVIANYYLNNPIEQPTIAQARRYKRMLRPFGKTIKYLAKLKELGAIPMPLVNQTLNTMSIIANYYKENAIDRSTIKQARRYKRMLRPFGKTIGYFNKLKTLSEIPMRLVTETLIAMSGIANFYKTHEIDKNINVNIDNIEYAVSRFVETSSKITEIKSEHNKIIVSDTIETCQHIIDYYNKNKKAADKDKAEKLNEIVKLFSENADHLKNAIKDYKPDNYYGVKLMVNSMKSITDFLKTDVLDRSERKVAEKNIEIFKNMTSAMSGLSTIDQSNISSVGSDIKSTLDGVNAVDISQVNAVTNMFNAFSSINKSQNAIDKFTKSVNEFTAACKNLMSAMGDNTDAINNMNGVDMNNSTNVNNETNYYGSGSNNTTNQTNSIRISNVEEIAKTIAERINGALSVDVPDAQIQLLINGAGGNEWIISRY